MADPLLGTWWSQPPPAPVTSEFTTPGDLRRAQMIAQTGFDPDHPWLGLARQLLTYMPMVMPGRARAGADTMWAAGAPDAGTGPWSGYISALSRLYRPGMDRPIAFGSSLYGNVAPNTLMGAGNTNTLGVTLPPLLRGIPGGRP